MQVFRLSEILNFSIFKEKKNNIAVLVFFLCGIFYNTVSISKYTGWRRGHLAFDV